MTREEIVVLVAVFLWSVKPGPGHMAFAARLFSDGVPAAAAMAVGTYFAHPLFIWSIILGLSLLSHKVLLILIQLSAAIYLIWVAGTTIHKALNDPAFLDANRPATPLSITKNLAAGFSFAFLNPLNIAFYAAVIPQFMDLASVEIARGMFFTSIVVILLAGSDLLYLGLAYSVKHVVFKPDRWRRIVVIANVVFLLVALYIVISSMFKLLQLG